MIQRPIKRSSRELILFCVCALALLSLTALTFSSQITLTAQAELVQLEPRATSDDLTSTSPAAGTGTGAGAARAAAGRPVKLPTLFDFIRFKGMFKKSYAYLEDLARNKLYLANAFRVFLSGLAYKYRKRTHYLAINQMSDWTRAEVDKMYVKFSSSNTNNNNSNNVNINMNDHHEQQLELLPVASELEIEQVLNQFSQPQIPAAAMNEQVKGEVDADDEFEDALSEELKQLQDDEMKQRRKKRSAGESHEKIRSNFDLAKNLMRDPTTKTGKQLPVQAANRFVESNNPHYEQVELLSFGSAEQDGAHHLTDEEAKAIISAGDESDKRHTQVVDAASSTSSPTYLARLLAGARSMWQVGQSWMFGGQGDDEYLPEADQEQQQQVGSTRDEHHHSSSSSTYRRRWPAAAPSDEELRNKWRIFHDSPVVTTPTPQYVPDRPPPTPRYAPEPPPPPPPSEAYPTDEASSDLDLPDEVFVDLRQTKPECYQPVRSQGNCGSCYAFATIALYEWLYCSQKSKLVAFSEQYVVDCGHAVGLTGCDGGLFTLISKFVLNYGLELRQHYPYRANRFQCPYSEAELAGAGGADSLSKMGYIRMSDYGFMGVPISRAEIYLKQAPMVVNIHTAEDFYLYGGGVDEPSRRCSAKRGHSVLLIGSGREDGQEYWLFRNSHSAAWGEQGHYKMSKKSLACIQTEKAYRLRAPFVTQDGKTITTTVDNGRQVSGGQVSHGQVKRRYQEAEDAAAADDVDKYLDNKFLAELLADQKRARV